MRLLGVIVLVTVAPTFSGDLLTGVFGGWCASVWLFVVGGGFGLWCGCDGGCVVGVGGRCAGGWYDGDDDGGWDWAFG